MGAVGVPLGPLVAQEPLEDVLAERLLHELGALHLVEGDLGNARYWFAEAGRPVKKPSQIDELWDEIAGVVLK